MDKYKFETVVYIRWEGRGYGPDSFEADLHIVEKEMGNNPIAVAMEDVGVMFATNKPATATTPVRIISIRHGQVMEDKKYGGLDEYYSFRADDGTITIPNINDFVWWEDKVYATLGHVLKSHPEWWNDLSTATDAAGSSCRDYILSLIQEVK